MGSATMLALVAMGLLVGSCWGGTDEGETAALLAVRESLGDKLNRLSDWRGADPCGDRWTGIFCVEDDYPSFADPNVAHITEVRLEQLSLDGFLAEEVGDLLALKVFNVMWNQLTGSIPASVGRLKNLKLLLLSGNQLTGILPLELGTLPNLYRLQIDQNQISGPIPETFLDRNIPSIHHLHMNNNSLNGSIPAGLATLAGLAHLLLDNNQLTGVLPPELADAPSLMILQLDGNQFDANSTIPSEYGRMKNLLKLSLRNCRLGGEVPDLSGAPRLSFLDLSHNQFTGPVPNATTWANLSSVDLSFNEFSGEVPANFGAFPKLQYFVLRNNKLRGEVPRNLGAGGMFTREDTVSLVDLQKNDLDAFEAGSDLVTLSGQGRVKVWMAGNPFCGSLEAHSNPMCAPNEASQLMDVGKLNEVFGFEQSSCTPCPAPYVLAPSTSSPITCRCASPASVRMRLKSYCFGIFEPYEEQFLLYMAAGMKLQKDQVAIKNVRYEPGPRLAMTLLLFPTGFTFEEAEISRLYKMWAQWLIPMDLLFGPYEFISFEATPIVSESEAGGSGPKLSTPALAAISAGAVVFVACHVLCIWVIFRRWKRERERGDSKAEALKKAVIPKRAASVLKVSSVRAFTFEEMEKATNSFHETNLVGEGGYGRVYSGVLDDGQRVAIKRAEVASFQGVREFENEILLLSRVHHKNLVALVGYCNDGVEQVLVYEFIAHGCLHDHLTPEAKIPMDFATRLRIALGSARGIHYLHTQASPPIYHRDVKTTNILLDEQFHPKVSDFGLSKLAPEPGVLGAGAVNPPAKGYISTIVKGTPGYLDPEYFKTHRLTDKSDVYSFGVVMLVLVTGLQPIYDGKNLVREVTDFFSAGKVASIVDHRLRKDRKRAYPAVIMDAFIQLALRCCNDVPAQRPDIGSVLSELELLARELGAHDPDSGFESESDSSVLHSSDLTKLNDVESFIEIVPESSHSCLSSDPDLGAVSLIGMTPR